MPSESLVALVGWSLTGERFSAPDLAGLVTAMREAGWNADELAARRVCCQAAGIPWPAPVSADQRGEIGAAQFAAAQSQVRRSLGMDEPTRVRDGSQPLSPHDRELLADVPPHHVAR